MASHTSSQSKLRQAPAIGGSCADCEVRMIGICSSLDPEQLERMRRIIREAHYDEGQLIFSEGEPADNLFNVVTGAVRLIKLLPDGRRQITGFLFPGDFLGIALNATYAYSAEAIVGTKLCRMGRREMEAQMNSIPNFEHRLLGEAAHELVAAQDQMLLLGRKTSMERLGSFLLSLSQRARRHGLPDNPIALAMSRTDIADFLGLTTETVSRTFTKLRNAKIIALEGNDMVRLIDMNALKGLLAGDDSADS